MGGFERCDDAAMKEERFKLHKFTMSKKEIVGLQILISLCVARNCNLRFHGRDVVRHVIVFGAEEKNRLPVRYPNEDKFGSGHL